MRSRGANHMIKTRLNRSGSRRITQTNPVDVEPVVPPDTMFLLQRQIGNRALNRLIGSQTFQAKLKIDQPGDKYEKEAYH